MLLFEHLDSYGVLRLATTLRLVRIWHSPGNIELIQAKSRERVPLFRFDDVGRPGAPRAEEALTNRS